VGGLGLLEKPRDLTLFVDLDDTKARDLIGADGQGGQGHVRTGVFVLLEHLAVVHFVDVIAAEDDDVPGLFGADRVDVLVDGIGGALIPVFADTLHRRQNLNEFAEFLSDGAGPAFADVAVERKRFVLGEDVDAAEVGVDAVG
jgi:hypothetical protein